MEKKGPVAFCKEILAKLKAEKLEGGKPTGSSRRSAISEIIRKYKTNKESSLKDATNEIYDTFVSASKSSKSFSEIASKVHKVTSKIYKEITLNESQTYSRAQIFEALSYWQKQLKKRLDESGTPEDVEAGYNYDYNTDDDNMQDQFIRVEKDRMSFEDRPAGYINNILRQLKRYIDGKCTSFRDYKSNIEKNQLIIMLTINSEARSGFDDEEINYLFDDKQFTLFKNIIRSALLSLIYGGEGSGHSDFGLAMSLKSCDTDSYKVQCVITPSGIDATDIYI